MPIWLITAVIVAAALLAAWWAEAKATIIIVELKAIRENLDKLWAEQSGEERDAGEGAGDSQGSP